MAEHSKRPGEARILLMLLTIGEAWLLGCGTEPPVQCVADSDCSYRFACIDTFCRPAPPVEPTSDGGRNASGDAGSPSTIDAGSHIADAGLASGPDAGTTRPTLPELRPLDYTVLSELRVSSDGPAGESPYQLFWNRFGDGSVEAPDLYSNNHPGERHITELSGGPTGAFFRFWIHRSIDRERDLFPDIDDRQRNEVKTFANSPEAGLGRIGETVRYHWYFRLPAEYAVTRYFNTVMQVKGSTGTGSPIFALVAARSGGAPEFQLRFVSDSGDLQYLARTPFNEVTGKWLEAEVIATLRNDTDGYLRTTVRELNGPLLLAVEESEIQTYRSDFAYVRPKWGIYRSVQDFANLVNETDTVDFADFTVQKVRLR